MENHPNNSSVAASANVAQAQGVVARSVLSPWWYYPVLGLMCGLAGVALILGNGPVRFVAALAFLLAAKPLESAYRQATGVWIGGLGSGAASIWSIAWLVLILGIIVATWIIVATTGLMWLAWVSATVVVALTLIYGRVFERALRSQLQRQTK